MKQVIGITSGDPAGIGPEVIRPRRSQYFLAKEHVSHTVSK